MSAKVHQALAHVHGRAVHGRRVSVLARHLAELTPVGARVLDVGSGDGRIAAAMMELRPDLTIEGVDVLVRPDAVIATAAYDGRTLPQADGAYDVVQFVDVLHHTDDPRAVLAEGLRVARHAVVLKDHDRCGVGAEATLRFMDWVGNRGHGVALPYNYLTPDEWSASFGALGLVERARRERLGLYPWPFHWLFERSLHFVARLEREAVPS